jgi:hypothetical protein
MTIEVKGEDNLAFTLRRFAAGLDDMAKTHRDAADLALKAARSRAPVKTGQLRASGMAGSGAGYGDILFTAPYAAPIHWGWPARNIAPSLFAVRGVEESQEAWLGVYADGIQDDLGKVKGA